ncbi:uncharacterized protein LOC130695087 [Daphnia carinata]|uniref:uncharacterized protein LOC130695087 n=1 Tax=Daphnia carinata TaxID=120202 RepID=UPI00257C035D|nr:uncharacterized protein LOC130695087 [Daphnia carinata]
MDDIDTYLDSVLKKDIKLRKFIQGTLENGPTSDSDEQDGENRKESLSFMPSTSSDLPATETDYGSSSVERAPAEMNQSCDPVDTSSFEVSVTDDDLPDLILHFAEPNDFERDCVSAHVKRLKREIEESAKRKEKRHEQPKQRQFTGKPVDAGNNVRRAMKPKPRRRQCKKPYGLVKKSNDA